MVEIECVAHRKSQRMINAVRYVLSLNYDSCSSITRKNVFSRTIIVFILQLLRTQNLSVRDSTVIQKGTITVYSTMYFL